MPTLPTRDFVLILDPYCADALSRRVLDTVADLAHLDPPLNITFVVPAYLGTDAQRRTIGRWRIPLVPFGEEADVPNLELSRDLLRRVRDRIERGVEGEQRGLRLLALADYVKADGIVTTIPSVVDGRYHLLRHHKFRILLPDEVADFVEVCARGHSLFCSASFVPRWLPPDVIYQATHWKNRRLAQWFGAVGGTLSDATLRENLRSALLNRYSMISYARDMVRFFELQKDHHFRRAKGQAQVFRAPLNYHLTTFYAHVWGMLDALAGIANQRLVLGVSARRCGIGNDNFLKALGNARPALVAFIKRYRAKWIDVIGDVRHPIAHSALRLQQEVFVETQESKKSDAEIVAILRREEAEIYEMLSPDIVKVIEPQLIYDWRLSKMKKVTDDAIYVEQAGGRGYFRSPVRSIDFDVEMLNAFIDAFLICCFGTVPRA